MAARRSGAGAGGRVRKGKGWRRRNGSYKTVTGCKGQHREYSRHYRDSRVRCQVDTRLIGGLYKLYKRAVRLKLT